MTVESRYRIMVEAARDGIIVVDPETLTLTDVNREVCDALGYSREELMHFPLSAILPPRDLADAATWRESLQQTVGVITRRHALRKDGSVIDVELSARYVAELGIVVVARDITERRRTEQALRQHAALDQLLLELSTELLGLHPTELDGAMGRLLARLGSAVHADLAWLFKRPTSAPEVRLSHSWRAAGSETSVEVPSQLRYEAYPWAVSTMREHGFMYLSTTADLPDAARAERDVLSAVEVGSVVGMTLDANGRNVGLIGFATLREASGWDEATVRQLRLAGQIFANALTKEKGHAALQRSEREYRLLFEHATYGIYRSTVEGRFLSVNPALVTMLGYGSEHELLQLDLASDLYAARDARQRFVDQYVAGEIAPLEAVWKRKDGVPITVRLSGRPVRSEGGKVECFEMFVENVTERALLETQLRHAQKLEAIGQFAGGLAHDLNNVLSVVLANAELIDKEIGQDRTRARTELMALREAAGRGRTLIKRLLAFTREGRLEPRDVDLNLVVREVLPLLQRLMPREISIELLLGEGLPTIAADTVALDQILMNLASNAGDALSGGGSLTIETRAVEFAPASTGLTQRGACLVVRDTGHGMDKQTLERIFEPFFTTKAPDRGTGLGLAVTYSLMQQHGGRIEVDSQPGIGTEFRLCFPAAEPVKAASVLSTNGEAQGRRETILVVDDEPNLRKVVQRILEGAGYNVLTASDGESALAIVGEQRDVDLIMTDVVMPNINGPELHERVSRIRPGTRFLFASGFPGRVTSVAPLDTSLPFIQKPWSRAELLATIRKVLDA